jgi:hypothetical protein
MRLILPRATVRVVRYPLVSLFVVAACGAATTVGHGRRSTEGAITGLTRDGDSAEPLGATDVKTLRPNGTTVAGVSGRDGVYTLDHLPPGRYTVVGAYAGQTVTMTNVAVDVGEATYVDLTFTPSRPVPYTIDYSDPRLSAITKYHRDDGPTLIEGTVADSGSRHRIPGAVVTAFGPSGQYADTLQTITDDNGRFRFAPVPVGVYVVSAYYSVGGRGQIEVRRSDIHVDAGDDVNVPLFIETTRQ